MSTTTQIYPKQTSTCTILLVSNLAYPQWVSVNCEHKIIGDVICVKLNTTMRSKTYSINTKLSCTNSSFVNDGKCYKLAWFNGTTNCYKDVSQKCHSYGMNVQFIGNISAFKFLMKSIYAKHLIILSLQNSHSNLIQTFHYEIIWYQDNFNTETVDIKQAVGYFVCRGQIEQLTFHKRNCHLCQNSVYIYIISLCDGINDCQEGSDEMLWECKELNKSCKEINDKKKCYCPPLFYQTITGTCSMYTVQTFKTYENTDLEEGAPLTQIDTHLCTNSSSIPDQQVNDLVPDCQKADDETLLKSILLQNNQTLCHHDDQLPCKNGHTKCFNTIDACIYRLDKFNNLYPCRTGAQQCKDFECNQHYKCPGYYCIPWGYVCDGKWDCPYGSDESSYYKCVKRRQCTTMFKCKNTLM